MGAGYRQGCRVAAGLGDQQKREEQKFLRRVSSLQLG